jgi:hypothetical protein
VTEKALGPWTFVRCRDIALGLRDAVHVRDSPISLEHLLEMSVSIMVVHACNVRHPVEEEVDEGVLWSEASLGKKTRPCLKIK